MKILIDIPAEEYRWIRLSDQTWAADVASKECMMNAIKKGMVISDEADITKGDMILGLFKKDISNGDMEITPSGKLHLLIKVSAEWWNRIMKFSDYIRW